MKKIPLISSNFATSKKFEVALTRNAPRYGSFHYVCSSVRWYSIESQHSTADRMFPVQFRVPFSLFTFYFNTSAPGQGRLHDSYIVASPVNTTSMHFTLSWRHCAFNISLGFLLDPFAVGSGTSCDDMREGSAICDTRDCDDMAHPGGCCKKLFLRRIELEQGNSVSLPSPFYPLQLCEGGGLNGRLGVTST